MPFFDKRVIDITLNKLERLVIKNDECNLKQKKN